MNDDGEEGRRDCEEEKEFAIMSMPGPSRASCQTYQASSSNNGPQAQEELNEWMIERLCPKRPH